uniref:Uncharacterized protein n=1 Tax=Chenopodium quinoa TaxID=63459 RepID=A0A803M5R5_CHEQI
MSVLAREKSRGFVRMPSKSLRCMSYEDTLREMEAFLDGKLENPQTSRGEVYADITEPMNSNAAVRLPDSEDPDATENSSSFGDTTSRSDNVSGTSDAEVESEFRVDTGFADTLDSYTNVFPMRQEETHEKKKTETCGEENKKSDQDGISAADDDVNLDVCPKNEEFSMDDDWLKDGEDSIEQILRQIETVQSKLQRLRTHFDTVMLKNGVKFSSSENLSLLAPYDAQTSAAQSPAFSAGDGDNLSIGGIEIPHDITDFEIGDLDLPESLVSDYGVGTQIPDIIESTVGLLSAANVPIHQPQTLESGENILDDTHIQNRAMQDGHMSSGVIDKSIDEYNNLENKEQHISSLGAGNGLAPDSGTVDAAIQEKTTLKSCLTSKIKRKRGERKAGPGGWSLRSAGEPDSN